MSIDEQKHAGWFEKLHSHPITNELLLQSIQVKPQAIKLSIAYVEDQIKKANSDNVHLMEALSVARDLENALIEKQFSKLNNSGPDKIRSVLSKIITDTEKHRKLVSDALNEEKGLSGK